MTTVHTTIAQSSATQPKSRRWRWLKRGLIGFVILIIVLPMLGMGYEAIMAGGDAERYLPPGQVVNVNGHNMHIHCMGDPAGDAAIVKNPTVILESGFADLSLTWALVQPEIASFARVCSYDRSGYGWSESSPDSHSPRQVANDLHTLLTNAGIEAPFVLVGHSLGGKYVRMFADLFPDEVAGMVLVDTRHESLEPEFTPEENAKAQEAYRSSLGLYTLLGRTGVARAFGTSLVAAMNPAGQYLPAETRELIAIFAGRQRTVDTMIVESADSTNDDDALRAAVSLDSMPLTVLVARTSIDADPRWLGAQEAMAALSTNSHLVIVEDASHTIQWDQPGQVIDAVRGVVEES